MRLIKPQIIGSTSLRLALWLLLFWKNPHLLKFLVCI